MLALTLNLFSVFQSASYQRTIDEKCVDFVLVSKAGQNIEATAFNVQEVVETTPNSCHKGFVISEMAQPVFAFVIRKLS